MGFLLLQTEQTIFLCPPLHKLYSFVSLHCPNCFVQINLVITTFTFSENENEHKGNTFILLSIAIS